MIQNYYNKEYFKYQDPIGKKTVRLKSRFQRYISFDSTVLDFGCGAGYLLESLKCKVKIGLDINEIALREASKKGIKTYTSLVGIKNNSIDCIISHSVLGHLSNPFEVLNELKTKIKSGGVIIFSIPHETLNWKFKPLDINNKFYTWSPRAIGNLFLEVGFQIIEVKVFKEISFPKEMYIQNSLIIKVLNLFRPFYRVFRLILEELGIYRLGIDGSIIIYAKKQLKRNV